MRGSSPIGAKISTFRVPDAVQRERSEAVRRCSGTFAKVVCVTIHADRLPDLRHCDAPIAGEPKHRCASGNAVSRCVSRESSAHGVKTPAEHHCFFAGSSSLLAPARAGFGGAGVMGAER